MSAATSMHRKRNRPAADDDDDDDHKAQGSSKNTTTTTSGKRRKVRLLLLCEQTTNVAVINDDALSLVMQFVEPRELLALACTCKRLKSCVTTEMVVKSAMMCGGHAKQTIEELAPLMKNQQIYPPTPHRLLRLVCGKRCEICQKSKVYFVRPGYGVFICWKCLKSRCTQPWNDRNLQHREIFQHPRVAALTTHGTRNFVWCKRSKATCDQIAESGEFKRSLENIGPIIALEDIENMAGSNLSVDQYLSLILQAPQDQDYAEFVRAYNDACPRSQAVATERRQKRQNAREDATFRRHERVLKIVAELLIRIKRSCRDFALEYNMERGSNCIKFQSKFVDSLLVEYVRCPSRATKKRLIAIAEQINTAWDNLDQFLLFSFLNDSVPFQSRLKSYCLQQFGGKKRVFMEAEDLFFAKLAADQPFEALDIAVQHNFGFLVCAHEKEQDKRPSLAFNIWEAVFSTSQNYFLTLEITTVIYQNLKNAVDEFIQWLVETKHNKQLAAYSKCSGAYQCAHFKFLADKDFESMKKALESDPNFRKLWQLPDAAPSSSLSEQRHEIRL